jgi:thioesterase DpgC
MTGTAELLVSVGVPRAEAARIATVPTLSGDPEMARDFEPLSPWLLASGELLHRLPPKPQRSAAEQAAAAALLADARQARERFAQRNAAAVYHRLTAGRTRLVRLRELAYAAARELPGLVPTEVEVARERALLQMNQDGAQIDQGILLAHFFADRASGLHLLHAMAQPTEAALALLGQLRRTGRVQLRR